MWWQVWWVWAASAGVLGILEVLAPGYIFLGFAVGALAMTVLALAGTGIGLAFSMLIFALASLAGYMALRALVPGGKGHAKVWDRDINE